MPGSKGTGQGGTSNRGFTSMDENKQRDIASQGGKAAHEKGTAHEFTSEEARQAGQKAHAGGGAHEFTSEEAREAGRKGGESRQAGAGSSTRGGTSEQHAKAGSQSHKNR